MYVVPISRSLPERDGGVNDWQVKHQLDGVLQRVVEEDESRLVQEQARVLLRAIMVSALV